MIYYLHIYRVYMYTLYLYMYTVCLQGYSVAAHKIVLFWFLIHLTQNALIDIIYIFKLYIYTINKIATVRGSCLSYLGN